MSLVLNGTDGLSDVDGSAATPAIRGTDANTGIFFPAADTIAFAEGGAEVMRIDSSGNVGIGTSSPSTRFEANTGAGGTQNIATIRSSNVQLKIGTTDVGNGEVTYNAFPTSNSSAAGAHVWQSGGAERARIDSSGNFLNNCTGQTGDAPNTAGGRILETNGNQKVRVVTNGQVGFQFYSPSGGTGSPVGSVTVNASSTSYVTSSDYRLKENIAPMTGALSKVAALKPVTYSWKNTGEADEGFIAHELQEVCPSAVTGEKDAVDAEGNPKYQGIDTSFLVATLTAAIQELKAIVDAQGAEIAALKGTQP